MPAILFAQTAWADPDATAMVLESGASLRFVGLDVTEQVRLTRDDAARLARSGHDFGAFAGACTQEWIAHQARTQPGDPRAPGRGPRATRRT